MSLYGDLPQGGQMGGLMLGTVLANNDSEKKGTLKVRLNSEGASKNILEGVKLIAPFAGEKYGVYMLPEIGEQVLVGFLEGCFDRPVVLGSLYVLADQMLSNGFHSSNAIKRFQTKGGTIVEFCDEQDEEKITIKTPRKLSIVMNEKPQTIKISAADTTLEVNGKDGKITANAKSEITLKTGNAELVMGSGGNIALKGNKIELKASEIKVDSNGTLALKGQKAELSGAMVEVKASGIMTVKGAMTKIN